MSVLLFLCLISVYFTLVTAQQANPLAGYTTIATPQTQIDAVLGLISRVVPAYQKAFTLQIIDADPKGDVFEIEGVAGKVVLRGNTGVAISSGLNYYLKYFCNCQVSWTGDQLNLPQSPPQPSKVRVVIPLKYRYYFNVCTFGYTTVWWNWDRWQREIDWMALNGINTPLAFTGQEAIWFSVYASLGLNSSEINDLFTGPAFLPWNRMGNVNGWGDGLPGSWLYSQSNLQRAILNRTRSFGMTPILPAFAGHVPSALSRIYPKANITQLDPWDSFPGTYFLAPSDPLFAKIGATFIQQQAQVYGTDHLYNTDPFNELNPPSNDPIYLASVSKTVLQSMVAADSKAVWVMQGWFLVNDASFWQPTQAQAYLSAVPNDKLIMLDLWAESKPAWQITDKFYGKDFVWCTLNNFGGRTGIFGSLPNIASYSAAAYNGASNMQGVGLTPEAIETNYLLYELTMELAWRLPQGEVDISSWVQNYTIRRYGAQLSDTAAAWTLLQNNPYSCNGAGQQNPDSLIALRPSLSHSNDLCYNASVIPIVLAHFISASANSYVASQPTFLHDIAAVTRQLLSNTFTTFYLNLVSSANAKDIVGVGKWSTLLLDTIIDVETVVATQDMWLVGKWIAAARSWGTTPAEVAAYEFNARNQLTLWGPQTSDLHDYAYKLWSGLVADFYYPRWNLFVSAVTEALANGVPFDQSKFTTGTYQMLSNKNMHGVQKQRHTLLPPVVTLWT